MRRCARQNCTEETSSQPLRQASEHYTSERGGDQEEDAPAGDREDADAGGEEGAPAGGREDADAGGEKEAAAAE